MILMRIGNQKTTINTKVRAIKLKFELQSCQVDEINYFFVKNIQW